MIGLYKIIIIICIALMCILPIMFFLLLFPFKNFSLKSFSLEDPEESEFVKEIAFESKEEINSYLSKLKGKKISAIRLFTYNFQIEDLIASTEENPVNPSPEILKMPHGMSFDLDDGSNFSCLFAENSKSNAFSVFEVSDKEKLAKRYHNHLLLEVAAIDHWKDVLHKKITGISFEALNHNNSVFFLSALKLQFETKNYFQFILSENKDETEIQNTTVNFPPALQCMYITFDDRKLKRVKTQF